MPVAIPGVVIAMGALLALLLLWGVRSFGNAMASLIPKGLPIIGDSIHTIFATVALAGAAAMQWLMADVIRPMVNLVVGPVVSFITWLTQLANMANQTATTLHWLIGSAIPDVMDILKRFATRAAAAVHAYAAALYNKAIKYAHGLYTAVHDYALSLYRSATAYAHKLYVAAHDYAASLYRTVHAYALALYNKAISYAATLTKVLRADMVKADNRLESLIKASAGASTAYVTSVVGNAIIKAESLALADTQKLIGAVDIDITAAIAATWPKVVTEVQGLEGVIGLDLPDLAAAVKAIPRAIPLDQVGAIAAVGSIALPLIRFLRQCGVPNCRNLSKYGRDLQDLLGAMSAVGLVGLFAEMVTDPEGTAEGIRDGIGGLVQAAGHEAASLLGVG